MSEAESTDQLSRALEELMKAPSVMEAAIAASRTPQLVYSNFPEIALNYFHREDEAALHHLARLYHLIVLCRVFGIGGFIFLHQVAPHSELDSASMHCSGLPFESQLELAGRVQEDIQREYWAEQIPTVAMAWKAGISHDGRMIDKVNSLYSRSNDIWAREPSEDEVVALMREWLEVLQYPEFEFLPLFSRRRIERIASVVAGAVVQSPSLGGLPDQELDFAQATLERAVSALEDGNTDFLTLNMDLAAIYRFKINSRRGDRGDYVERAINLLERTSSLLKGEWRQKSLNWLSEFYAHRFNETRGPTDLDAAISNARAFLHNSEAKEAQREIQIRLASALVTRFSLSNAITDLDEALEVIGRLKSDSSADSTYRSEIDSILLNIYTTKFRLLGTLEDCDAAIHIHEISATLPSPDVDNQAMHLDGKAVLLAQRYLRTNLVSDIEGAVATYAQGWPANISNSRNRILAFTNWAEALLARFEALGNLRDLEDGAALLEREIGKHNPETLEVPPRALYTLGVIFQRCADRTGNKSLLMQSISLLERVCELAPDDRDLGGYLQSLAHGYSTRFSYLGDSSDLEHSIELVNRALAVEVAPGRARAQFLESLSAKLVMRFDAKGSLGDLAQAIGTMRESVASTPSDDPQAPGRWYNLGIMLQRRYALAGNLETLSEAIDWLSRATMHRYQSSPFFATWLSGEANALISRFQSGQNFADINLAIAKLDNALRLTPKDSEHYGIRFANLGDAYLVRYNIGRDRQDLNRCIEMMEEGCRYSSPSQPNWGMMLNNLGGALYGRFIEDRSEQSRKEALVRLRGGVEASNNARATLYAVKNWMTLAFHAEEWLDVIDAFGCLEEVRDKLVAANPSREFKAQWLSEMQGMGTMAAVAAVEAGQLREAVVALEQTQATLLNEVLDLSPSELDHLEREGQYPLVSEFIAASRAWREMNSTTSEALTGDKSYNLLSGMADARRALDDVIERIRLLPGFEAFLRPRGWEDIQAAVRQVGILAYAVAGPQYGFILLMGGVDDHPELVRLPELTAETFSVNAVSPAVTGRAFSNIDGSQGISHWEATYDRFANWFWRVTIAPLLDHIGYGRRPITVVPIGRLIGAPWTSAWTRSDDARSGRRYLPDRLDIRFAPNARVLSRERQAVQREELNLLAVTASGASGTQPLKYGNAELAAAMSGIAATKALTQESATREAIMGEIRGRTAIHICCHGSADALQPLDSFLLVGSDERITMRDLLSVRLDGMEMVMLSACETGVHGDLLPDEAMGLASAILAAGSRACIAASWPIPDLATAMLAYRFHYEWRHAKFDPGAALIRSQLWLREPRTKRSTRTSSKRPLSRMGTRQRRQ